MAHFLIKNHFQKKDDLYEDLLTEDILADITFKLTGETEYTVEFDNTGYNIGRMAILEYEGTKYYVSFSEVEIRSRNSSFQSFPSALARYILEESENKEICFYFHPSTTGNFETPYFIFMYRLMKTAGVKFLNEELFLTRTITPFTDASDIVANKERIRSRNRANKSTYVTRGSRNQLQIFGKTYGANKYETTILCVALSEIARTEVELYQIGEGGLTVLPKMAKLALEKLGVVRIYTSDRTIEQRLYDQNESYRSPEYNYNLLEKLGDKKCAFCECDIPQIIQGAHIWPVASIKREEQLTREEKLEYALDGENGLWLCNNHHKLFDVDILRISDNGRVKYRTNVKPSELEYLQDVTLYDQLIEEVLSESFVGYLGRRNENILEERYSLIHE